jgi:hypothetical protein
VTQRVNLTSANLANKNLSNANIDDAIMPGANLTNTNLTGTNLSESDLTGANFTNASLYNTCLCYADLTNCNFAYTSFGATDISGAILAQSRFSSMSCFTLDFIKTQNMQGCSFIHNDGSTSKMSNPPIVISGLDTRPTIIMDDTITAAQSTIKHNDIRQIAKRAAEKITRTKYEHEKIKDNH